VDGTHCSSLRARAGAAGFTVMRQMQTDETRTYSLLNASTWIESLTLPLGINCGTPYPMSN